MAETHYIKCPCIKCWESLEFQAEGLGEEIECPNCHQKTILYNPVEEEIPTDLSSEEDEVENLEKEDSSSSVSPSLRICKTCKGFVAESAEVCIHCGQQWPTTNLFCPDCGANDFDIEVIEDNSSVWVTPSLLGVLSAAIWEGMRAKPKSYIRCLQCGCLSHFPSK
jgi:RNA polymerase subunit RPABC4/transcription elongation factor Spt4